MNTFASCLFQTCHKYHQIFCLYWGHKKMSIVGHDKAIWSVCGYSKETNMKNISSLTLFLDNENYKRESILSCVLLFCFLPWCIISNSLKENLLSTEWKWLQRFWYNHSINLLKMYFLHFIFVDLFQPNAIVGN